MRRKLFGIILCFWMVCLMAGCSGAPGPSSDNAAPDQISESQTPMTDGAAPRTKAEVLPARMDQAASVFIDGGYIDLSQTEKGFIGVSFQSDVRMKFQVIHEEETYTYDLPSDGTETIYPLNMGDGTYVFKLMQNVGGIVVEATSLRSFYLILAAIMALIILLTTFLKVDNNKKVFE